MLDLEDRVKTILTLLRQKGVGYSQGDSPKDIISNQVAGVLWEEAVVVATANPYYESGVLANLTSLL